MLKDIRLLEIELFSYCNRTCKWCPNRTINRKTTQCLDDKIFENVIQELAEQDYQGVLTFSRYNEPLSRINIFKEKLKYIREHLPHTKLVTNTNGDFVTKENLEGLEINELSIMDYDGLGMEGCKQRLLDLGAEIIEIKNSYILSSYGEMKILYCTNWIDNRVITDRGGFLAEYSKDYRNYPCFEPKYFCAINYDGTVSPCCNFRNDIKEHQPYIIGDLHYSTLQEILTSKKACEFRSKCARGEFEFGSPCYYCANMGGRYTKENGGIMYAEEDRNIRASQTK